MRAKIVHRVAQTRIQFRESPVLPIHKRHSLLVWFNAFRNADGPFGGCFDGRPRTCADSREQGCSIGWPFAPSSVTLLATSCDSKTREDVLAQTGGFHHWGRPSPTRYVEQKRPRCIGHICCACSRQPIEGIERRRKRPPVALGGSQGYVVGGVGVNNGNPTFAVGCCRSAVAVMAAWEETEREIAPCSRLRLDGYCLHVVCA